jgi:hypothetical protein
MKLNQVQVIENNVALTGEVLKQWLRKHNFKISKQEVEYTFLGPPRDRTGDPTRIQQRIQELTQQPQQAPPQQQGGQNQPPPNPVPALPTLGFHEWLTFETVYNAVDFRQTNQELALGRYSIPVACLDINMVVNPPQVLLDVLGAFLPCMDAQDFDLQTHIKESYTKAANDVAGPLLKALYQKNQINRGRTVVDQGVHMAIMPYNYHHNDSTSPAIGTMIGTDSSAELMASCNIRILKGEWRMWNTASRSKIVEIPPPQGNLTLQLTAHNNQKWPHTFSSQRRMSAENIALRAYTGDGKDGEHFKLGGAIPTLFSIKTGVQYIGKSYQGGAIGKDVLEKNCHVSRLRSDYMVAEDLILNSDKRVLVQHELLSMTCKPAAQGINFFPGDGISIRDLSCLDRSKIYFPPLSIPNAGEGIVQEYNALHSKTESFDSFWGLHYAALLGECKARLLLRYGVQFCTPNPQNFLLEFNQDLTSTGKFVLRDVGDANLHVEVTKALHNYNHGKFNNLFLDAEYDAKQLLNDEQNPYVAAGLIHHPYDTETDKKGDNTFYPSGTQFHWHNYSIFKGQYLDDTGKASCTTDKMVRWGHLHDNAYVDYLNVSLGLDLPLTVVPDIGRVTSDNEAKQALAAELQRARELHKILISAKGIDAIKAFRRALLKQSH